MVLPSGYLVHAGRLARLDARGAFTLLAQLRGTGPAGDSARRDRPAGRRPRAIRRRSGGPARGAAVRDRRPLADADRAGARRRSRRHAEPARDGRRSTTTGVVVEPGAGATSFDRDQPAAGPPRPRVRGAGAQAAHRARVLAAMGLRLRAPRAQHFAGAAARPPCARSPRKAGASRPKGAPSVPRSRCAPKCDPGIDWFELHGTVDFGDGLTAALPRLLEAVRQGKTTITLDDGSEGMVPEEWLRRFAGIVERRRRRRAITSASGCRRRRCSTRRSRRSRRSASTSGSCSRARSWRRSAAGSRRSTPPRRSSGSCATTSATRSAGSRSCGGSGSAAASPTTWGSARPSWCWRGSIGCARRAKPRAPSLVVVPRSVVFNWIDETARFAPELRVLDFSGADRSVDRVNGHHVVLTTYGTLRRDALLLKDVEFEYAILDEAQAIKNANTAGSKAARLLRAQASAGAERHADREPSRRAVEPVRFPESRACWARPPSFARHGVAAARRDPEALDVLSRGVRPFILRRTKAQVAPELPPRSELTIRCELQGTQRELYDELRDHYRAALLGSHPARRPAEVEDADPRGAAAAAPGGVPSRPGRPAPRGRDRRRSSTRCCRSSRRSATKGTSAWSSRSSPACSRCCARGSTPTTSSTNISTGRRAIGSSG